MTRSPRTITLFIALALTAPEVRADLIAAPAGRPSISTAAEGLEKLEAVDRIYFAENPARIRTARGLFDLRPKDDGISAWAPPIEIGLAFVVGVASVVKFVLADLPASVTVKP